VREDLPVVHHCRTDVGIKRSHNQDSFAVGTAGSKEAWRARGHLYVVADGMGAHAVGELASQLAVDTIRLSYSKARGQTPDDSLRRAIVEANKTIHDRGQRNPEFQGMGTTATALVLGPDGALIGHVGDSRCYRIRGDMIEQLSFDHSLLWEVARRQNVLPEDIKSVPKNIIVRSLGPEANVNVDVNGPYKVRDGDRFLLCTDGLSGQVTDREIWTIVSYLDPEDACGFLIDLANYRGGIDNVTLLLVQVGDPAHPRPKRFSPLRFLRRVSSRIYNLLPLVQWLLLIGSVLCVLAAYMRFQMWTGWLGIGVPGLIMLLAGLTWNQIDAYRRKKFGVKPPQPPPPIYRSQQCSLQPTLVEKLAKNEVFLRETAQENDWQVDWEELRQRRESAERCLANRDMTGAFRDYCRSLSVLFAGMRQARNKQEVFDPHWQTDKT
jgi:protein phosphatase